MSVLPWCIGCFVLSALAVRAFLSWSRRELIDAPGTRSSHERPTPTGGGFPAIVSWLATGGAAVAFGPVSLSTTTIVAGACATVLAAIGLADDRFDLPRALRYGVHVAVGCVVVLSLGRVAWPPGVPPVVQIAFWVVVVTALINCFNFMDGIDALVGGTGSIILGWLAYWTGSPIWWLLASAYAGFLVFNLPPARIFMGDAGSTVMGGLVAVALIASSGVLHAEYAVVLAPLMGDSGYTLARRLLRRENIFRAHHSHLYQRLLRAGHRHGVISAGYAAATCACAAAANWAAGPGAVSSLGGCVIAVAGIELHVAARRVPFTRPSSAVRG